MKKQQDIVIDAFEAKVMQLITVTDITKLPQWTDADVIGAVCLLKTYRYIMGELKDLLKETRGANLKK